MQKRFCATTTVSWSFSSWEQPSVLFRRLTRVQSKQLSGTEDFFASTLPRRNVRHVTKRLWHRLVKKRAAVEWGDRWKRSGFNWKKFFSAKSCYSQNRVLIGAQSRAGWRRVAGEETGGGGSVLFFSQHIAGKPQARTAKVAWRVESATLIDFRIGLEQDPAQCQQALTSLTKFSSATPFSAVVLNREALPQWASINFQGGGGGEHLRAQQHE